MYIEHSYEVALPMDVVYKTLRDDLVKLTKYLPNIKNIEIIKKEKTSDGIQVLSKWQGKYLDQALAGRVAHIEGMAWLDRAEWHDDEHICNWSFTPFILDEYINFHGRYTFSSDGTHTIIKMSGDLKVDIANYPLIPSELKMNINEELMQNFIGIVKINFNTIIKGLEEHVRKNK